MMPRTKINPVADPNASEFENFERFAKLLMSKRRAPKVPAKSEASLAPDAASAPTRPVQVRPSR